MKSEPRRGAARPGAPHPALSERGFRVALAAMLLAGLLVRALYLAWQPSSDPTFAQPMLDGKLYLEWARALAAGQAYLGAFYLAPLYPHLLAVLVSTGIESLAALYLLQQLVALGTALGLAWIGRQVAGAAAGLGAAACYLLYHPPAYFAARPLGETVAIALLVASTGLVGSRGSAAGVAAGIVAGLAALGRPNLLAVPVLWALVALWRGPRMRAAAIFCGLMLVITPVLLRNYLASGHVVPISSNAGLTAYHGNGPGATGLYTYQPGFSGSPETQREEATAMARARTGRLLDDVEADRWWGREALRERLRHPVGTLGLIGLRSVLVLDTYEHALDYPPMLDANPWRFAFFLPFAALLGLAAVAVRLYGFAGSGGSRVWSAILACALAPLLFYVSSRYRLPAAVLLSVPAGVGAVGLLTSAVWSSTRARTALVLGLAVAFVSAGVTLAVSRVHPELFRNERAWALSNRAGALLAAGELERAEHTARRAVAVDTGNTRARYNLALALERRGRRGEAEAQYRSCLAREPGLAEAAVNLARLLVEAGRPGEAVAPLRAALLERPGSRDAWTNLVVALATAGDAAAARKAADEAERRGVHLEAELLESLAGEGRAGSPR